MREKVVFGLTIVLSAVLLFKISPYLRVNNIEAGDRAPTAELADIGVDLGAYKGKYVLLNFWATWCAPCVQEKPQLNALHQELSDKGLVVLSVSVDSDEQAYKKFLDRFGIEFPTARDPGMTVPTRYGTSLYPESYLIDREGYVERKYAGPVNWMEPEVRNYLRSLL